LAISNWLVIAIPPGLASRSTTSPVPLRTHTGGSTSTSPLPRFVRELEEKAQKDSEVFFDGQTLQFPWCDDRKAAGQVERNARWIREFIAPFPPKEVPVEPVIVVPGWYVTPRGKYPIKVMNASYLVGYLKGVKPLFTRAQLDPVVASLDGRCRTLEF